MTFTSLNYDKCYNSSSSENKLDITRFSIGSKNSGLMFDFKSDLSTFNLGFSNFFLMFFSTLFDDYIVWLASMSESGKSSFRKILCISADGVLISLIFYNWN